MARRAKGSVEGEVVEGLVQLSARVKPEQDLILTVLARAKGIDKGVVVQQAIDAYVLSLPEAFRAAVADMAKSLQ